TCGSRTRACGGACSWRRESLHARHGSRATFCRIANCRERGYCSEWTAFRRPTSTVRSRTVRGQERALNSHPIIDPRALDQHHQATAGADFVDEDTPLPPAVPLPIPSEASAKLYDQLIQDEPPPDRKRDQPRSP